MLKDIKLDDRTYNEIRDEAVANIVKHCPEWTNHNVSDPGITIIELLSSMMEDVIIRLNQVPEKNYIAFLDLIGIKQRLPRPAMTKVTFFLSEGYQSTLDKKDTILIKKGSKIATDLQNKEEPILFETTKDLYVSNLKLSNIYSKTFDTYRQRYNIVNNMDMLNQGESFIPFSSDGASENMTQLYLFSEKFSVFEYRAKISIVFRLPTTMRVYKIKDNFLESIYWEFYNGDNWQPLNQIPNHVFTLDDKNADILTVTFQGENSAFKKAILEQFSEDENYYIRASFRDTPIWLKDFAVYEIGILTSSYDGGVLPNLAFHNFENLNLNNDFYPFGSRPKIDNRMMEEIFYINSNESFRIAKTSVSIDIRHSLNPDYIMPKGYNGLKLVWEYPIDKSKWNYLLVEDNTNSFINSGTISFEIPNDMVEIDLNGEEGYWVRCRIIEGNYGAEEKTVYDEITQKVITTPSTLNSPIFSEVIIHYTRLREDIDRCVSFVNFKYNGVKFIENIPTEIFKTKEEREEALFLAFDSYLSEDYLTIYFDIDNSMEGGRNLFSQQRVVEWKLLKDEEWIVLEDVIDETDGITKSGDVIIKLPQINKLEKYTLYIDEFNGMWIKAQVKSNSLKTSPKINNILLNTVDVVQQETHYNELTARSDGLPNLQFNFNYGNLSKPPIIYVGDEEFKPVNRFIDYGKDDKVFRFNGVVGQLEFGDGEYGAIPKLGENIYIREYSVTEGKKGNINSNELKVLREAINYIDSLTNYKPAINGEDGDNLDDLKKYAPSVLKTMNRAISVEDYELLAQNFSPSIKRAKCQSKDGEVVIIPFTENIIENNGFINQKLLDDLKEYLSKRSLLTVEPIISSPTIINLTVYLKLLYTIENYNISKIDLEERLKKGAKKYFDPFKGYNGDGFPMGKIINKSDFYTIVHQTDKTIFIDEINFSLNGSKQLIPKVNLTYNQLIKIEDIVIEELSYDI